jgi:hypothetical protein
MPVINFGALQPVIDNTGLSAGLSAGLSEVHGYLGSPQKNGLANLNSQQPPSFARSIQSSYPNPIPGLKQPPRVDFKGKAQSLYGNDVNGEDIIQKFLNKLRMRSDANAAFQDLVNEYVQESFVTPGGVNTQMNEIMETYEDDIIELGREVLNAPNDIQKHNFARNGFYEKLTQMANTLRPRLPPAAESTAADPPAADPPAPPEAWYKFWGGRKTALIRSRNRSGKKTRARKMKQRSRKRAVRRR